MAERSIQEHLKTIAEALTRQAVVMESDLEAERKALTPDQVSEVNAVWQTMETYVRNLGERLDSILTATYPNEMFKARALRDFQKMLVSFNVGERFEDGR